MSELVQYQRPEHNRAWTALLPVAAELAGQIAGTDFVPTAMRNNPAMVAAAILYGDEIGIGPMQSLARISVINGRPTLAAEMQRALILAAGHDLWVEESTPNRCTICGRRKNSEATSRITWTLDDAKRAGLAGKPPWRLYPRQMLLARASAELARAVFPDAIGGLASTEELEDNPELAALSNGQEPPPTATPNRRRRRANVAASAPDTASETAPRSEAAAPTTDEPTLPPDEQAIVDQLEQEFGARPVESTPHDESEPEQAPITDAQRRKIHALFREQGISDRDERLAICSNIVDRDVPTSTSLTLDEASQIIDHLEQGESPFQPPPGVAWT
jgi:hypothetical protein